MADDPVVAARSAGRDLVSGAHRGRRAAAPRADAGLPVPLQAGVAGRRLLPGVAAGQRRSGHRPHRRGSPRRRSSPQPGAVVDVDAIVLATGFETSRYLSGIEVIGAGGQGLHERWGADPSAYLGVAVSGFPNFFMLYGPNTNQGGNSIVYILEAGARLVASAVTPAGAPGRIPRCASRGRKALQRRAFRGPRAHHLDPVRQLLPVAHRAHRHPMALYRARIRAPHLAAAAAGLAAPHRGRQAARTVQPAKVSHGRLCRRRTISQEARRCRRRVLSKRLSRSCWLSFRARSPTRISSEVRREEKYSVFTTRGSPSGRRIGLHRPEALRRGCRTGLSSRTRTV